MTRTTLRMTKSTESKINYFEAKLENDPALIKNIPSSNNGLINMLLNDYLTLIINAWNKSPRKRYETIYQEFSSRRIEKFTLVELSQKATVCRSTIYNNFGSLEYVYKDLIEKVILKEITRDCQSYEELIKNLVTYIYDNKMLCLNLYRQTVPFINQEHVHRQIMED